MMNVFFPGTASASEPWPYGEGSDIAHELPFGYEASGTVWHGRLNILFLVGDGGDVATMDANGHILKQWYKGGDLEGITVADPDNNYVYIASERVRIIKEFDFSSGLWTGREWDVSAWLPGTGNDGIESVTFVPNGHHPYEASPSGGVFYVGFENNGYIHVFDFDLSGTGIDHLGSFHPYPDYGGGLSGLHYCRETHVLYAMYRNVDRLVVSQTDGTVLARYEAPGGGKEGVTAISSNGELDYLFVTLDKGSSSETEVWRYGGDTDRDCDGLVDGLEDANHNGVVDAGETDPRDPDTDDDHFDDGDERAYWGENWDEDIDGDGQINLVDSDSDNDGFKDGFEVARGYDPADPESHPEAPRSMPWLQLLLFPDVP